MTKSELRDLVKILRPTSKIIRIVHTQEIHENQGDLVGPYYVVVVYDSKISAEFIEGEDFTIVVHNVYLSHFAYFIQLSWLYILAFVYGTEEKNLELKKLINFNLKRFFADQLFYQENSLFSRSILIESVLFEQSIMNKVFDKAQENEKFKNLAEMSRNLMSNLIVLHELGHLFLSKDSTIWKTLMYGEPWLVEYDSYIESSNFDKSFKEELRCDIIGFLHTINNNDSNYHLSYLCNSVVLGFSLYAVFYSLLDTVNTSGDMKKSYSEEINFKNLNSKKINFNYAVKLNKEFITRAEYLIEAIKKYAKHKQIPILLEYKEFPVPDSILSTLVSSLNHLISSDLNINIEQKEIARLVAESLYKHPDGMKYFHLKSMIFKQN